MPRSHRAPVWRAAASVDALPAPTRRGSCSEGPRSPLSRTVVLVCKREACLGDSSCRAKFGTALEPPSRFWLYRAVKEADDGSRTRDLELGKLALYQLSYVRVAGIPDSQAILGTSNAADRAGLSLTDKRRRPRSGSASWFSPHRGRLPRSAPASPPACVGPRAPSGGTRRTPRAVSRRLPAACRRRAAARPCAASPSPSSRAAARSRPSPPPSASSARSSRPAPGVRTSCSRLHALACHRG